MLRASSDFDPRNRSPKRRHRLAGVDFRQGCVVLALLGMCSLQAAAYATNKRTDWPPPVRGGCGITNEIQQGNYMCCGEKMKIADDVLTELSAAAIDGNQLFLTDRMDRSLYQRVNKVIEAAGGKWNRKAKCHVFRFGRCHAD